MSIGQQLLDVPFSEMVSSLGIAIATAQTELDKNSIEILKLMGEEGKVELPMVQMEYDRGKNGLKISDKPFYTSMIGAGFQPTFYQFAETVIEVKIAISMSYESSSEYTYGSKTEVKNKKKTFARTTTVDASYSSKYSYNAEGSSLLRTRLVPVPPNTVISQVIDMRNQAMNKLFQIEADLVTKQIEEQSNLYDEKNPPKKEENQNGQKSDLDEELD